MNGFHPIMTGMITTLVLLWIRETRRIQLQ